MRSFLVEILINRLWLLPRGVEGDHGPHLTGLRAPLPESHLMPVPWVLSVHTGSPPPAPHGAAVFHLPAWTELGPRPSQGIGDTWPQKRMTCRKQIFLLAPSSWELLSKVVGTSAGYYRSERVCVRWESVWVHNCV